MTPTTTPSTRIETSSTRIETSSTQIKTSSTQIKTSALVGPGRAGLTVSLALAAVGVRTGAVAGRRVDAASVVAGARRLGCPASPIAEVGRAADLLVIATPDAAIGSAAVQAAGQLAPGALVVHLAGSHGLDVFAPAATSRPDVRFAALHPLVSMPNPDVGLERLAGAWCAVAGDPDADALARQIALRPFPLADADRATYHAAATVASNHVVALLGQVERLAASVSVPFEAFLPLVTSSIANVTALGTCAALTGPVARGDVETVAAHLVALPTDEREAYRAGAAAALRLCGRDDPAMAHQLR